MSGAIRVTPSSSGRGLTLSIAPAWGRTGSATERLWSAHDARALGADSEFEGANNARENTEWPVTDLATISCTGGIHRSRHLARSIVKADLQRKNNGLLNLHRIE